LPLPPAHRQFAIVDTAVVSIPVLASTLKAFCARKVGFNKEYYTTNSTWQIPDICVCVSEEVKKTRNSYSGFSAAFIFDFHDQITHTL
jgi:hypothetical protein